MNSFLPMISNEQEKELIFKNEAKMKTTAPSPNRPLDFKPNGAER